MNTPNLLIDVEDRVAIIRLNRPAALNALTAELVDDLYAALDRIANDSEIRAVVISGEGRAFSAGADLTSLRERPPLDDQGRLDLRQLLEDHYSPLIHRMQSMPQPIIAAVNGLAAGAGASLALMTDLTIADRAAYFLQAFVHVGLVPDAGASWLLQRTLGTQRAMGLALLGDKLSAAQAKDWGMIWDVVDSEVLSSAIQLAKRLADSPALAVSGIKQAIRGAAENDLNSQLLLEAKLQRACGVSQDFAEGVASFLEKRKPVFTGN